LDATFTPRLYTRRRSLIFLVRSTKPMVTETEISRRVDTRMPVHPWNGVWYKVGFPLIPALVVLASFQALPDQYRRAAYPVAAIAAIAAHYFRDRKVMRRSYERSLLCEELYRKSRKPHKFKNCRIYYAEDHPAEYLYVISLDDGRFIECVSEDLYYCFRDGFPDDLRLEGDDAESLTVRIEQSGTRKLADPIIIQVVRDYVPARLREYTNREGLPAELRDAITKSEPISGGNR
jgi:hypothetical protein